ncbi:allantoate amidohydrolase [Kosakonia cowanii]|jgi:allantoate deiminase|uniref:allantoate amidohydrolase n=1 Tax=Kosakonia cowanii TaxID=208223 RepID=UPI001F59E65E|nr:allantoate amidohydrolase [Kosakonia cowanii]
MMNQEEAACAAGRVMARCDALAQLSESSEGLTRVYLSSEHLQANALVAQWMQQAGMNTWQDAVGNICGRYEAVQPGAQALLLGSHLDTVRNAGRYDGMLGVLAAIEVVDALNRAGLRGAQAIEIIGFADEEGTRFNIALLGSRGLTGSWPASWLACEDAQGVSVAQALALAGLSADAIFAAQRPAADFSAYLELHIEQGPVLEQEDLALGVVSAINGAHRLHARFTGEAGHAGTVPMRHRRDALAAAAEWLLFIEQTTQAFAPDIVATVGTLQCEPGAVNVIPGAVSLTLDIRSPQDEARDALLQRLLAQAEVIATRRGVSFSHEIFYTIAATPCDEALRAQLSDAVREVQGRTMLLPSGAGHDAIAIAERWPSAMLFVRCAGGISHHPAESVTEDDVAQALRAFSLAVRQIIARPSAIA